MINYKSGKCFIKFLNIKLFKFKKDLENIVFLTNFGTFFEFKILYFFLDIFEISDE